MEQFNYINEEFYASQVSPEQTDWLLADGWRHFGEHYYRYNLGYYKYDIRAVYALRVNLAKFSFSKNQRRVLKKNRDLEVVYRPIVIDREKEELFERHKERFDYGVPDSLYDFVSREPATVPCEGKEVCVYRGGELLGAAFFDVGRETISSIYGMFEPAETARSLGVLTMLLEIKYAYENGKIFYYHGYAYEGNSFYDYKKRFRGLESFDWKDSWRDFEDS
ncbi:MAG: arginine-tRNA-protein transferase [Acidobacteria bacterium]|nr:arginine-tRNA-protein transferase [Acidobacteriota bacterium]